MLAVHLLVATERRDQPLRRRDAVAEVGDADGGACARPAVRGGGVAGGCEGDGGAIARLLIQNTCSKAHVSSILQTDPRNLAGAGQNHGCRYDSHSKSSSE